MFILEVTIEKQVRRPSCVLTVFFIYFYDYDDVTSKFVYRKQKRVEL